MASMMPESTLSSTGWEPSAVDDNVDSGIIDAIFRKPIDLPAILRFLDGGDDNGKYFPSHAQPPLSADSRDLEAAGDGRWLAWPPTCSFGFACRSWRAKLPLRMSWLLRSSPRSWASRTIPGGSPTTPCASCSRRSRSCASRSPTPRSSSWRDWRATRAPMSADTARSLGWFVDAYCDRVEELLSAAPCDSQSQSARRRLGIAGRPDPGRQRSLAA